MSNLKREYSFVIDLVREMRIPKMKFINTDTDTATMSITVKNDGNIVDLTGCTIAGFILTSNGEPINQTGTVINPTGGVLQIELVTQALLSEGLNQLELTIFKGLQRVSTHAIPYHIVASLSDDDAIVGENNYSIVNQLLLEVQDAIQVKEDTIVVKNETQVVKNETLAVKEEAENVITDMQNTLNALAPEEATNVEVQVARDGEVSLKANLDKKFGSVNAQLADIATLTSKQFGIVGDGTDETSKLTAMFNAIPTNGAKLIFDKTKEITINGTSLINISNKQNVVIEGLRAKGTSEAAFQVINGSKNITFRDCVFKDFIQVIYLHTCEEIVVDNCTFDGTGYGVIQRNGFVSNNVKVINCTAKNMKKDFVEANCATTAPSKNWTISNNHYLGGYTYPTQSTEERFVGITGVKNVIISHNIIENICGDSAIHLEDIGGNIIIDHNIVDNVVGSSYIWIIHNEKTALIDGNIFLRNDITLPKGVVFGNSNDLTNNIKFTNNIIKGLNKNLDGFKLNSHTNASVIGNYFEECDKAITLSFSNDIAITSNEFIGCNYDIFANHSSQQGACNDIQLIGNKSKNNVMASVILERNTSGTQGSNRWLIQGNIFSNNATAYDTTDFTCVGNTVSATKSLNFGGVHYIGSTRYLSSNNRVIASVGWIDKNKGTFTFNGDGTTSYIDIPHGLPLTPSSISVIANSLDAGTALLKFATADATNIRVRFVNPPIIGTNNVSIKWVVEL